MIIQVSNEILELLRKPAENGKVIHYEIGENPKIKIVDELTTPRNGIIFSSKNEGNITHACHDGSNGTKMQYFFENISGVMDNTMEQWLDAKSTDLYINFDVLDPSIIDLGQEYGGMTVRQLIYCVQRIAKLRNLGIIEIKKCGNDKLTAKIIREIASNIR